MITLSHELANEQSQPHIRNAASVALKNALSARVSRGDAPNDEFPR
jgi:Importin-beta N-terminal domain